MASAVKIHTQMLLLMILALVALLPSGLYARDMLFLGVTDARGDPAHSELEREMRVEFAASPKFRLIGEVETQRVLREAERQGRPRTEAFVPSSARLADSVVVVRAVVKEFSVVPKRSGLLVFGKIDARMAVELFFSEVSGPASYRGEFGVAASKRKEVILFASPKTAVHISASDREELLGRMRSGIIKEASALSASFFNSLSAGAAPAAVSGSGGAATEGAEFSTVDGVDVQPIDTTGVSGGASGSGEAVNPP